MGHDIDQFSFLEQLVTQLSRHPAVTFEQQRRASVAVILRIKPKEEDAEYTVDDKCTSSGNNHMLDCILSVIKNEHAQKGTVEMLYIKRAVNKRDRWSGHVAFPGGHVEEETGESAKDAAERETLEEIGLDISNKKNFAFLGRLDDRAATNTLTVSSFVYLQICAKTPPLVPDPKEVAGTLWVPVDMFLKNANAMLVRPHVVQLYMGPEFLRKSGLLEFLGLTSLHFPSLHLPNDCTLEYILWGLTLGITSEIYILGADRIPLNKPIFRFENRLANGIMEVTYVVTSLLCPGKDISYRTMFGFVVAGMALVFVCGTALVVKAKV